MNVVSLVKIFSEGKTFFVQSFFVDINERNVMAFGIVDMVFNVSASFVGPLISD